MTASNARVRDGTLHLVRAEAHRFCDGFHDWLSDNWAIWLRFLDEAGKVKRVGRKHYSARTIIEYIRHETALREGPAPDPRDDFKINNNAAPDMARLYGLVTGDNDLFQLRGR